MSSLDEKVARQFGESFYRHSFWAHGQQQARRHIGVYQHTMSKIYFLFLESVDGESIVHIADGTDFAPINRMAGEIVAFAYANDSAHEQHGLGVLDDGDIPL